MIEICLQYFLFNYNNNNNNNTNICKAHIVSIRAESEVPENCMGNHTIFLLLILTNDLDSVSNDKPLTQTTRT